MGIIGLSFASSQLFDLKYCLAIILLACEAIAIPLQAADRPGRNTGATEHPHCTRILSLDLYPLSRKEWCVVEEETHTSSASRVTRVPGTSLTICPGKTSDNSKSWWASKLRFGKVKQARHDMTSAALEPATSRYVADVGMESQQLALCCLILECKITAYFSMLNGGKPLIF